MSYLLLLLLPWVYSEVANYGNVPKGVNPTLYASDDLVIQLDDNSFNDTIFCLGKNCTSYLVEVRLFHFFIFTFLHIALCDVFLRFLREKFNNKKENSRYSCIC